MIEFVRWSGQVEEPPASEGGENLLLEPSMLPETMHLFPTTREDNLNNTYPALLEKRVQRNPRFLLAHTQRILYHRKHHQAEPLWNALCDFFLAVGEQGRGLRENLLHKCTKLLNTDQYQFLLEHIKLELTPGKLAAFTIQQRNPGGQHLVPEFVLDRALPLSATHAIDKARQYSSVSDYNNAIMTLEAALQIDPGDSQVCDILLDLYLQLGAKQAFFKTYNALLGYQLARKERWQATELHFRTSHDDSEFEHSDSWEDLIMSDYTLTEAVYLLPTAAGAFHAVSGQDTESSPLRRLLLTLLTHPESVLLDNKNLTTVTDTESEQQALALLYQAQTRMLVEAYSSPQELSAYGTGKELEDLLPALSSIGKVMLADWNGLSLCSCGMDQETSDILSALSADLVAVQQRHADRIHKALSLGSQGWAAVDAYGASRVGAWPLFVGENRFLLVVLGEPRLKCKEFIELIWMLTSRYG